MRIEIVELTKTKKIIDIELPYYFKDDSMGDEDHTVTYGKLEEKIFTEITLIFHRRGEFQSAEIEIKTIDLELELSVTDGWHAISRYLKDMYKSNKAEYLTAKRKALSLFATE